MKVGDLVKHSPEGSAIEIILQKLSGDKILNDFELGVVVEEKGKMKRDFSHELNDIFWYEKDELSLIQ